MLNKTLVQISKEIFIIPIRMYQAFLSPLVGPCCRFYPTCSDYTIAAIRRYGPFRGLLMGLMRLLRCHPLHPGGYDPVT
jgi:uncharacterized protein